MNILMASVLSKLIYTDKEIESIKTLTSIGTIVRKMLIVVDNDQKGALLQIEVESGKTIRKLAFGIIDQLRCLRNCDDSIQQYSGIYFMRHDGRGHVIQVDIESIDTLFKFYVKPKCLFLEEVESVIYRVFSKERDKYNRVKTMRSGNLTLPLSKQFIYDTFGAGAIQYHSGQSVVIIVNEGGDGDGIVYIQASTFVPRTR